MGFTKRLPEVASEVQAVMSRRTPNTLPQAKGFVYAADKESMTSKVFPGLIPDITPDDNEGIKDLIYWKNFTRVKAPATVSISDLKSIRADATETC